MHKINDAYEYVVWINDGCGLIFVDETIKK